MEREKLNKYYVTLNNSAGGNPRVFVRAVDVDDAVRIVKINTEWDHILDVEAIED